MINFNKNKLINNVLVEYYDTFAHTRDTAEFVPDTYNDKILKYIFKNLKKQFKKIDKEDKLYQRELKKRLQIKNKKLK